MHVQATFNPLPTNDVRVPFVLDKPIESTQEINALQHFIIKVLIFRRLGLDYNFAKIILVDHGLHLAMPVPSSATTA